MLAPDATASPVSLFTTMYLSSTESSDSSAELTAAQVQALATKQRALDLLANIGLLPAGRIRDQRVAAYGFDFYNQPTAGDVARVEFAAKDILLLSASERFAFVKGVARVLRHLAAAGHAPCWCHKPATLTLTLAALATLVASGKAKRKQAFKAVNQVDWLCFRDLFLGQGLGYEDWIKVLAQQRLGNTESETGDFAELERLAGARILEFIGETGAAL